MNLTGVTVRDLLRLPILKDAKVISGEKGLDRIVRYLDIMEVPDFKGGWLREGELVLTTGYSMRHDPTLLQELVEELAQVGAAALAIKPERFISEIPQEVLDKSNLYNIPIIHLPIGIPYIDITYTVMEQILDKQAALLRRSEQVYKTLTNLVLSNSGIQVVADNVVELVKSPIWIINNAGEIIVSSPSATPYHPSPNTRQWEVTVDKQFAGKLIIDKEHFDELELICIEQARLVFALELMRRKIAHDTELRLRGSFFEELLMGLPLSKQEMDNKARQLGLQSEWIWEICIIEGESHLFDIHTPFFTELNELIHRESGNRKVRSYVQKQGDRLVLLLSTNKLGEQWIKILTPMLKHVNHVHTGFGRKCSLLEVYRSYLEAKKAIMIGSRLEKDQQIFTFEQVEMFSLLLESSESVNFDTFIEEKIGKLYNYDKENGMDLVTTFHYYLASGGSLIDTANRLFIHRNSVKYRMDRIKEIADVDMDNAKNWFAYYLCTAFYLLKKMD
ncbi:PucR family transcriptional regulator ligand-binding domain-containing protein [Paenibacillus alginolyticus]|uniref:PucR family transcriptional regulator n=1 Tax=Paenibacillus alginolyticus TaxID=59839 RepID=UPI0003F7E518|nr:PucR family transcriptional regulator [Paenibacillus alginolyticus]MCY9670174.1 PucR family transcriptional regulator ligand-binding domain-containing protein [Paenibacillus alginolyticus]